MALIWRHVSTSEDRLHSSGTKYIKTAVYSCIVTIVPALEYLNYKIKEYIVDLNRVIFNILYTRTGCPRKNGQNFGRVFLMLNYTDITQNTYIQS